MTEVWEPLVFNKSRYVFCCLFCPPPPSQIWGFCFGNCLVDTLICLVNCLLTRSKPKASSPFLDFVVSVEGSHFFFPHPHSPFSLSFSLLLSPSPSPSFLASG